MFRWILHFQNLRPWMKLCYCYLTAPGSGPQTTRIHHSTKSRSLLASSQFVANTPRRKKLELSQHQSQWGSQFWLRRWTQTCSSLLRPGILTSCQVLAAAFRRQLRRRFLSQLPRPERPCYPIPVAALSQEWQPMHSREA